MSYRILTESSQYELTEKVKDLIDRGWRPQGGVSFAFHSGYKETWTQAMVKE